MTEIKLRHVVCSHSNSSCSANSRDWWNKACAFKNTFLLIWQFHTYIQCSLIKSTPHSLPFNSYHTLPRLHPKFMYSFFNSLSPHGAANLCLGIGPTTGAWATYQESHLKKTGLHPQPDEQLSTASCFSAMSWPSCAPILSKEYIYIYSYTYIIKNIIVEVCFTYYKGQWL